MTNAWITGITAHPDTAPLLTDPAWTDARCAEWIAENGADHALTPTLREAVRAVQGILREDPSRYDALVAYSARLEAPLRHTLRAAVLIQEHSRMGVLAAAFATVGSIEAIADTAAYLSARGYQGMRPGYYARSRAALPTDRPTPAAPKPVAEALATLRRRRATLGDQEYAIRQLGESANPEAIPHLLEYLTHDRQRFNETAAWAFTELAAVTPSSWLPYLDRLAVALDDAQGDMEKIYRIGGLLHGLRALGPSAGSLAPRVAKFLDAPTPGTRATALDTLAAFGEDVVLARAQAYLAAVTSGGHEASAAVLALLRYPSVVRAILVDYVPRVTPPAAPPTARPAPSRPRASR